MVSRQNTTETRPIASDNAHAITAQAFHKISDMEDPLAEIEDIFQALNLLAIAIDDEASPALCRLCLIGTKAIRTVEKDRGELFQTLHPFAYPRRGSGEAQ